MSSDRVESAAIEDGKVVDNHAAVRSVLNADEASELRDAEQAVSTILPNSLQPGDITYHLHSPQGVEQVLEI